MDRKRQHCRSVTSPLPEEEGLGEKVEPSLAKEGRGGSKKQHRRVVTSFPLMVKGKAWLGIKDPPAGEGQVGQKQHCRAVISLALLERARAWEWVKDPPVGEEQVGQKLLFL